MKIVAAISAGTLLLTLAGCNPETTTGPSKPVNTGPIVDAGQYQITGVEQPIQLIGSAVDLDGFIVTYEWFIDGTAGFIETSGPDTTVTAPSASDESFTCLFRVTDNDSNTATDSVVFWVVANMGEIHTRLIRPNGGETYHVGDTLVIEMWPSTTQVGIGLFIDDNVNFNLLAGGTSIVPEKSPRFRFALPDSILGTSIVSETCRIRVFEYGDPGSYVESAQTFAIRPAAM